MALFGLPIFIFGFVYFYEHQYYPEIAIAIFLIVASYITPRLTVSELRRREELAEKRAKVWKNAVLEQSSGYPSLMNAIKEYEKFYDDELARHLAFKKHPAVKSADTVRKVTQSGREAQYNLRKTLALIDYYESIAPFI